MANTNYQTAQRVTKTTYTSTNLESLGVSLDDLAVLFPGLLHILRYGHGEAFVCPILLFLKQIFPQALFSLLLSYMNPPEFYILVVSNPNEWIADAFLTIHSSPAPSRDPCQYYTHRFADLKYDFPSYRIASSHCDTDSENLFVFRLVCSALQILQKEHQMLVLNRSECKRFIHLC